MRAAHLSQFIGSRRSQQYVIVTLAMSFATSIFMPNAHSGSLRTVALSGIQAPGTQEGARFNTFGAYYVDLESKLTFRGPVINDLGQTAFRANLSGRGAGVDDSNYQGIWSEGAGSLGLVARTGSGAPGAPEDMTFSRNLALELFTPVLNNAGQTAFYGGLSDGSVGVWSGATGNVSLVARDGMQAVGTPDGVQHSFTILRDVFADLPKLNEAGDTSFWANLKGDGVNYTNDWGIWSGQANQLNLVARSGNAAAGMPGGVNYESLLVQTGFNDHGEAAFFGFVAGEGVNPTNDQGIWSGRAGNVELVARIGEQAVGAPDGVTYRDFFFIPTINNAGRTAFNAMLIGDGVDESNDEGLWIGTPDDVRLVARRGSPAPGTSEGVNFGPFSYSLWPVLNDAGQVAFRAELAGEGISASNSRGIWVDGDEGLELLARTGDAAPDTAVGVRFTDLYRPTLNSAGQAAFRGVLAGSGVTQNNNLGIWATDYQGEAQLIARTGAQLEVAPNVFRTILDLGFVGDTGNGDGRASGFNNRGQLVFWARFNDGSEGVFVSNLVTYVPGDTNGDLTVDLEDLNNVRNFFGMTGEDLAGDANGDGAVDLADLNDVRNNFGVDASFAVPEPQTFGLMAIGASLLALVRRRALLRHACAIVGLCATLSSSSGLVQAIEFNRDAKSPAYIPYDPNATYSAQNHYVTGRVPTNVQGPIFGADVNVSLGADAFYSHGFTGTNSVIANIEAGHVWSGHEALTHAQRIPKSTGALDEFDRHATWVGMILAGRRGGANPGAYQEGMAPGAQLYSGALAGSYGGQRYALSFDPPNSVLFDQFRRAFLTGVNESGRRADVINSSWGGYLGSNGADPFAMMVDGYASENPRTLFVVSAGNDGPGVETVRSPAAAYNNISVGALGPNPPYDRPTYFTSSGPNDYIDPVNGTVNQARQMVDISAPGENLSSAYYGGETGGNGHSGPIGLPSGSLGGPNYYSRGGLAGTSFAAPTVAGGAALLYDAAYATLATNDDARDARVIKAVLMNSADKTAGWNNGQSAHPNAQGGVFTRQGLDNRVGTGRMNLSAAYDQFLSGQADVAGTVHGNQGVVETTGWDFGEVAVNVTNDYFFESPLAQGSLFTATLTWYRDRAVDNGNNVSDKSYDDLNLELWSVVDGAPALLISESSSLFNNSEHFSFALPDTGEFALRVRWFDELFDMGRPDADQETYGLAWSVAPRLDFLAGDTDFDGDVDLDDVNHVRNNFGGAGLGDTAPADGVVDLNDLNAVRDHFGARGAAVVPEPATVLLALLGAGAICLRYVASQRKKRLVLLALN